MRQFTLEEYKVMSERFNRLDFYYQMRGLIKHKDILKICSDHNWWGVKVRDEEIQEQLEELGEEFSFGNKQWGVNEIVILLSLLDLGVYDL